MEPIFLNGIEVVHDKYLPGKRSIQVKFPKSKKKRIRNKWSKDQKNFKITAGCLFYGSRVYVCTELYNELLLKTK